MLNDLKTAFRQMLKFPGYTTVVVLILAFGLAVNTQIFGMVSQIFLRPMPVSDPGRLVAVVERSDVVNVPTGLSLLDFQDMRNASAAMTDFVAFFPSAAHVSDPGMSAERVWVEAVTPDAFSKLGITTVLGRPLQAADGEMSPGVPVVVLTHRYWQSRFGGDRSVVGRTLLINAKPFTVVGVARPGFDSFTASLAVGAFVPSGTYARLKHDGENFFKYRAALAWRVLAHLKPGATVDQANAELGVFAQRMAKKFPEEHRNVRFQAISEQKARPDPAISDLAPVLAFVFLAMVTLVLAIACANVANLMSARALDRQKELVVRAALGASRFHLIRQLLVESMLLALIAGVVAFLIAWWGSDVLSGLLPTGDVPLRRDGSLGWGSWAFTVLMSLVAGFAAGLFPALRASRADVNEGLKQAGRGSQGRDRHWLRNALVIGQVAVSSIVLIGAAFFLRTLSVARQMKLGFGTERVLMAGFDLNLQGYDDKRGLRFEKELLDRVRALPGVEAASVTQHLPFSYGLIVRDHYPDNSPAHLKDGRATVTLAGVDPAFLRTMGIPLFRGRDLAPTDNETSPHVAVINEAMANLFWPGMNPIGQHFHRDWAGGPPIEVVGVVATGKYLMLAEEPRPYYYCPLAQSYDSPLTLVVRTAGDPHGLTKSVREIFHVLDADLPVYAVTTMDEHLSSSALAFMPLRAGAILGGVQGVIALVLAILGLYAVVSYGVTSRTREIGVRMALGATEADILRLVAREGLWLTAKGLIAGITLALLASIGLSRVLFGVKAADPVAFPTVIAVLLGTAALACFLPARRATKIEPVAALRVE